MGVGIRISGILNLNSDEVVPGLHEGQTTRSFEFARDNEEPVLEGDIDVLLLQPRKFDEDDICIIVGHDIDSGMDCVPFIVCKGTMLAMAMVGTSSTTATTMVLFGIVLVISLAISLMRIEERGSDVVGDIGNLGADPVQYLSLKRWHAARSWRWWTVMSPRWRRRRWD